MSMEVFPSYEEFEKLSRQGNLIPVYAEVLADLETPVSAFLKLRAHFGACAPAFLLESVEGGESVARFSFLGVGGRALLTANGAQLRLDENGEEKQWTLDKGQDPLHAIEELMQRFRFVHNAGLPRFCGGAVGFLGWDLVRFFEKLPDAPPDDRGIPDVQILLTDTILIFDSVRHSVKILNNAFIENDVRAAYDEAVEKIGEVLAALEREPVPAARLPVSLAHEPPAQSNMTQEQYEAAVTKCIEYIHAGDCTQIVPSQRFAVPLKTDGFQVYRALRHISPAPYNFYLHFPDVQLIGASPEILVTEVDGVVRTRPLAGTRRRGANHEEDLALEAELLADPKERAEHVMLVDLGRNDLGRVCQYGSVQVNEFMVVERYSHVMHLASDVTGKLAPHKTQFDVLRAAFPAGTLSGSPKVRAMQIIDEVEPTRRGPYGGAIGYFSFSGNLDNCIALRTIVVKDGIAYVQAGAGVVADSVPTTEYEETVNKAKAALRAIALAEQAS